MTEYGEYDEDEENAESVATAVIERTTERTTELKSNQTRGIAETDTPTKKTLPGNDNH